MTRRSKTAGLLPECDKKWKIALYIRLSKEDGKEVSNSVLNQKTRLLQHLHTFDEDYELAGTYIDDGFTGTDTQRESFRQLVRQILARRVNCVMVKDLSRLSRNIADASYYIEHVFVEYRVRFISLELPALDSYKHPEQMNSILLPIQSVINDDFCRQTSVKVRGVLEAKRRQGQYIGAFGPYGYKRAPEDKHRLILDPEAACVVKDIFAMYVTGGMSKESITRKLNALGIPSPAEYKRRRGIPYQNPFMTANSIYWSSRTVTVILENEMYIGSMVQGRERVKSYKVHTRMRLPREEWSVVENTHEAVVSKELFEKARLLLQKNTKVSTGEKHIYLLSGFCRCPDCQKALSRIGGNRQNSHVYYICSTYRNHSREACTKHSIRIDRLEKAVTEAVRAQVNLTDCLGRLTVKAKGGQCACRALGQSSWDELIERSGNQNLLQAESDMLQIAWKKKEKELAGVTRIKDGLYADWKNGFITQEDFVRLKADYETQAERIRLELQSLEGGQLRASCEEAARGGQGRLAATDQSACAQEQKEAWLRQEQKAAGRRQGQEKAAEPCQGQEATNWRQGQEKAAEPCQEQEAAGRRQGQKKAAEPCQEQEAAGQPQGQEKAGQPQGPHAPDRNAAGLSRSLLADLVEVIYVHENGTVEILFCFRDVFSI